MDGFNPAYFTIFELFNPLILVLAVSAAVSFLNLIFSGKVFGPEFKETFFYLFLGGVPVSLVGYAIGFLTGISRSPILSTVLPAMLAALGGLSVYAFGTESKHKFMVSYCVSLVVVNLFYGTQSGSYEREQYRESRLKATFELEKRLQNYRVNRGLPEKAADWLYLGEVGSK